MFYKAASRISSHISEGLRSAAIMATGDILAQTIVEKTELKDINYVRTIKYSSLGLLFGPTLKYWYTLLDRKITVKQSRWQRTVKKVVVDQAIMAPTLNLAIIALVGMVNSESSDTIKKRIRVQYPDIIKNSYMLWPAVQMINFSIVPLKYQVVFVQSVGVLWNCFISQLLNGKSVEKQ